jgi:hypothetical protein
LGGVGDGDALCVLEDIIEVNLAPLSAPFKEKRILGSDLYVVPSLGASILEVCIAARDQWMVSWRSGVVSSASTMTSLGEAWHNVVFDGGHLMFDICMTGVLSCVVVASTIETTRIMHILS